MVETVSRRRFLKEFAAFLTAASLSTTSEARFGERRINLNRKAIVIAGGTSLEDNHPSFYMDLLMWNDMLRTRFGLKSHQITNLYYDGMKPDFTEVETKIQALNQPVVRKQGLLESAQTLWTNANSHVEIHGANSAHEISREITSQKDRSLDQLFVIRSGHGSANVDKSGSITSMMKTVDGDMSSHEYAQALSENYSRSTISFLMQCEATTFLDVPTVVPNAAVLTATGGNGTLDLGYTDLRNSLFWSWTESIYNAFSNPYVDGNSDSRITLDELQSYILEHDQMHVHGILRDGRMNSLITYPGMAVGSQLRPEDKVLIAY